MKIILRFFQIMLAIAGAYVAYMFIIALLPGISVPPQPLPKPKAPSEDEELQPAIRTEVSFPVNGAPVHAWLYYPLDTTTRVPCIVMAHGLGGVKTAGLHAYAARFQAAGFAALVFDYRHFGASGGEPRQLAWIPYQQADYAAAVAYARSLDRVDPDRIALWGTSLSGGHVVVMAARDPRIACVSAQCPLLDGDAGGMEVVKRVGLGHLLAVSLVHGVRDLVRSWLGLAPHKIPIVGQPGTVAGFADAEVWRVFTQMMPADFVNEICARIFIRMDKYHPVAHVAQVRCPVLIQVCDQDIGLPPHVVEKARRGLQERGQIIHYPIDHFDIYLGEHYERAVADQVTFFRKHLLQSAPDSPALASDPSVAAG